MQMHKHTQKKVIKSEAMKVEESKETYMGVYGKGRGKGKLCNYIMISKNKLNN